MAGNKSDNHKNAVNIKTCEYEYEYEYEYECENEYEYEYEYICRRAAVRVAAAATTRSQDLWACNLFL